MKEIKWGRLRKFITSLWSILGILLTILDIVEKGPKLLQLANLTFVVLERTIYYVGAISLVGTMALMWAWGVWLFLFPLSKVKITTFFGQIGLSSVIGLTVFAFGLTVGLYELWIDPTLAGFAGSSSDLPFYKAIAYLLGFAIIVLSTHDLYQYALRKIKNKSA